jgi:hypothetical protein
MSRCGQFSRSYATAQTISLLQYKIRNNCSTSNFIQKANGGIRFVWGRQSHIYVSLLSNSIEAQRAAIARFAEAEGITVIAEFVEAESPLRLEAILVRKIRGRSRRPTASKSDISGALALPEF